MPVLQKETQDLVRIPFLKPAVQLAHEATFGTSTSLEDGIGDRGCRYCGCGGVVFFAVVLASLSLFVLHQVTLWLSLDPETAFHRAKLALYMYEAAYDTTGNLWNGLVEVMLVAIPGWNSAVVYVVEPLVFTALDVLSIAFTSVPYTGAITEADVKYDGFYCPPDGDTSTSAEWCGMLSFYDEQLGVAAGSFSSFIGNSTVVLSTQTARRLAEATGEPVVGVLDLGTLAQAIQALLGSLIVSMGSLSDIVFHVIWMVLSEAFELIFDLFIKLTRALSSAVLMLVRSGALSALLRYGVDLLLVLVLDIGIPLMFAAINAFFCILDLTRPAGWGAQLQCGKPDLTSNTHP